MINNSLAKQYQSGDTQNTLNVHAQNLDIKLDFVQSGQLWNQGDKISEENANLSVKGDQVHIESLSEAKLVFREALRLKFKGIIINKVLGQIYLKDHNLCLQQSMKALKNIKYRTQYKRRVNLDEMERRTMIVLIQTTIYSIQKYILKVIRQAYNALWEQKS